MATAINFFLLSLFTFSKISFESSYFSAVISVHIKIRSHVSIEAEVVKTTHLLVTLNFCHYYIRVFLICPLLTQQLVQINRLQGAHSSRVFNQFVQVSFLVKLALLAFLGKLYAC